MYYKVKPNSETAKKLAEMVERVYACNKAALDFAKSVGASGHYRGSFDRAGGIFSFIFVGEPPTGWKKKKGGWYPKNKELVATIEKLPRVGCIEWADLFGCELFQMPGCFEWDGVFYIEGNAIGDDFEQIKMSEWAVAKESLNEKK